MFLPAGVYLKTITQFPFPVAAPVPTAVVPFQTI